MTTLTPDLFTLTEGQQEAIDAFDRFYLDPTETVFVISGYSGCGKSTLVRTLIDSLPSFQKAAKLLNPNFKEYSLALTATTNKAAENLAQITGEEATTIHSFLGLRVETDWKTGQTRLIPSKHTTLVGYLIFIDEASQVDHQLLKQIFSMTPNCKIVFIGDPAQLTPVKATDAPVFTAKFNGVSLTEVVRQAEGNPIIDLSTKFRNTVNTGKFFNFKPDGHHVCHMSKQEFNEAITKEFTRKDWSYSDSKILAWTNKCVIAYNNFVRELTDGSVEFKEGDYAVCNNYMAYTSRKSIKTDELVLITNISADTKAHDTLGNYFTINNNMRFFMPKTLEDRNAAIKQAKAADHIHTVANIEQTWIDLRAAYACTINKAQGSTFDKVFIDLNDIRRCNSGDLIARMLYVAVSRARDHVYLYGDLA